MKVVVFFALIFTFVCCIYADTFSINGTHADYPGMCWYDETPFPPGEHIVRRRCTRITCGLNSWVSVHTCIKKSLKENCKGGELNGYGKPFPECCLRKYFCKDDNGEDYVDLDF